MFAKVIERDGICSLLWPLKLPVLHQIKLTVYHGVFLFGAATQTYVEEVSYKTSEKCYEHGTRCSCRAHETRCNQENAFRVDWLMPSDGLFFGTESTE